METYSSYLETNVDQSLGRPRQLLRSESQNRVMDEDGLDFYECLARAISSFLPYLCRVTNTSTTRNCIQTLKCYEKPKNIKKAVRTMLENNFGIFRHILPLLVDDLSFEKSAEGDKKQKAEAEKRFQLQYKRLTQECTDRNIRKGLTTCCIYLSATCINTPIYEMNIDGQWEFFPPLFSYKDQPVCIMKFVTMHLTADNKFHKIESTDTNADPPTAIGKIGMYKQALEEIPIDEIDFPEQLMTASKQVRSALCSDAGRDAIKECWQILRKKQLVSADRHSEFRGHRIGDATSTLVDLVWKNRDIFAVLCKVLMKQRDKTNLGKCVADWKSLVESCKYLQKVEALCELDGALYQRNIIVANFIGQCQTGGGEIDERRRKVTTAVIATSSVGFVSAGLVVVGIVLAPVSFGASLGLSIAGGALGVGTGVVSGAARTFEALKQNSKMKDIEKIKTDMEEKEKNLLMAIETVKGLFEPLTIAEASFDEGPGISRRGFLAVGSAVRTAHSAVAIGLAAARLGTTAAATAASILGPISVVFDLAFFVEAVVNKTKGDKTNAGEMLENMVKIVSAKDKILNSFMRGNFDSQKHMIYWK